MAESYAYAHPPFHFLGHFTSSQWSAFLVWVAAHQSVLKNIPVFYQIRSQQLRKTAGILEQFYKDQDSTQPLGPTFDKKVWKPSDNGHFTYVYGNDHLPMVMMSQIKNQFKHQMQQDDESVFHLNQVRCMIEKHEDMAQDAYDFMGGSGDNQGTLQSLLQKINSYFSKPEYQAVLVDDSDLYKGQPYFRVHQADPPTQWELEQANHSDPTIPIAIKENGLITP